MSEVSQTAHAGNQTGITPRQGHLLGDVDITFQQVFRVLWRGKWKIIFFALLMCIAGGYYAYKVAVPVYTTNAVVTFESREEQVVDIQNVIGGLGGDQLTINTEVEVIQSRGLLAKLVRDQNLIADPEFNGRLRPEPKYSLKKLIELVREPVEAPEPNPESVFNSVVNQVSQQIKVTNVRQSYVFHITATAQSPEKAARLANRLAELYILDQLEVKFQATQQATAWLTDRVAELQVDLETSAEAVKEFNASSELISAETLGAMSRQIKDLRDRERDTTDATAIAQARIDALKAAQKAQDPLQAMANVADDRTLNRLLLLITDGNANDDTAFMVRYEQIISRAELDVSRSQNQLQALRTSVVELEAQISQQSEDLAKLQQLEREAEASRLIYEYFLGRLKETSVQQGIQQADSRVLSAAVSPGGPSAPRTNVILFISFFFGGFIGTVLVLLKEMSQNTIRTPEELEALTNYTVVGQIPMIPARRRSNVLKYLTDKPTSAAAEAVRNLRTSTLLSNMDRPPQVIMSTSSLPGEGKTTQSLSMAQNLSGLGKKVLLIEGDIRRRVFAEYFDIKGKKGLLAVLSGEAAPEDIIVHNEQLGADILVGEKSQTNAADVFSSEAFRNFLTQARELYDYIVIDTPPVLVVPDARVIGQSVDAILYTVKWDHTTKRQVVEGLKSLESVNIRVTGLVLSQINARGMKRYGYGDGYGYGAYGKYGRGYYDN